MDSQSQSQSGSIKPGKSKTRLWEQPCDTLCLCIWQPHHVRRGDREAHPGTLNLAVNAVDIEGQTDHRSYIDDKERPCGGGLDSDVVVGGSQPSAKSLYHDIRKKMAVDRHANSRGGGGVGLRFTMYGVGGVSRDCGTDNILETTMTRPLIKSDSDSIM